MPNGPMQIQPQTSASRLLRRAQRAHLSGELTKAERLYNALLHHHPDNFDALHGLGELHCQRGHHDTALVLIQAALRSDGDRADGFASLGLVFHCLRRYKDALASYDAGLALDPANAELLNRRGVALLELGRPREALENFECVLAGDPQHFEALGNYGNALIKLNRPQEAVAAYDRALSKVPENAQLLTNRAVALRRLDRPQEAVMSASRALVGNPGFAQARFVESVARLTLGDFAAGWRGYESRWSVGLLASQRRGFTAPQWLGNQTPQHMLDGKVILLHAEQGFGDTIQFARYAALVARLGAAKVFLEVQRELKSLLTGIAGVDAVIARGDPLPSFDLHCPLLSLPLALATELQTTPADVPYVTATDEKIALWRDRLPPQRPLIGVAWSGDRGHDNDLNRSIALEMLAPLFEGAGATFVSLQYDLRESDQAAFRRCPNLFRLETKFSDFADSAAVVSLMEAVVAVDTAVAHLAGAMAKPLLLLLPYAADFRWLRERPDTPWYPSARLYRQPAFGDWPSAIAALRQDLLRANFLNSARKLSA
ncbi:MAG TPA: tetratricopeptide repeat protein [Xanthobacteraceae bacterium]|nr:tetratricopeptide repeat protein [Xanthobacteraceae bacterium]